MIRMAGTREYIEEQHHTVAGAMMWCGNQVGYFLVPGRGAGTGPGTGHRGSQRAVQITTFNNSWFLGFPWFSMDSSKSRVFLGRGRIIRPGGLTGRWVSSPPGVWVHPKPLKGPPTMVTARSDL
eukprot:gene14232-biopygen554